MLTADGCRDRRRRLVERLDGGVPADGLLLGDPLHLIYLAYYFVDPFSLGADYNGLLRLFPDGRTVLFRENRAPKSVEAAHVDERVVVPWYDGQTPGRGPRRLALNAALGETYRVHDRPGDPMAQPIVEAVAELRRRKDADELAILRQ